MADPEGRPTGYVTLGRVLASRREVLLKDISEESFREYLDAQYSDADAEPPESWALVLDEIVEVDGEQDRFVEGRRVAFDHLAREQEEAQRGERDEKQQHHPQFGTAAQIGGDVGRAGIRHGGPTGEVVSGFRPQWPATPSRVKPCIAMVSCSHLTTDARWSEPKGRYDRAQHPRL